ncbi:MAG: hypothetical protein MZU97_08600 [Bacillus subtilis]|nr:hypothetical protein [Bacillus subtilis]
MLAYGFFAITDIYYFPDTWRTTFLRPFRPRHRRLSSSIIAASYHDYVLPEIHQWLISFSFIIGGHRHRGDADPVAGKRRVLRRLVPGLLLRILS